MGKQLLLLWILGVAGISNAETIYNFQEGALPSGWSYQGTQPAFRNDVGNNDNACIEVQFANSYLISDQVTDPGILGFWIRIPQYNDDYDLVLEMSADKINWEKITEQRQEFNKEKFVSELSKLFVKVNVNINREGTYFFRWSIRNHLSGSLLLDDISFSEITSTQKQQYATEKDVEELKRTVSLYSSSINAFPYQQARLNFEDASAYYYKNLVLLTNLIDKTRTIFLTSEVAGKLAIRNQMTNPLNYDGFKRIVDDVSRFLPDVKRNHLTDILTLLSEPLMIADKILLGGSLTTFTNIFKTLIGDAYSPANLVQLGYKKTEIATIEQNGISLYQKTRSFLDIIAAENQKVNRLNELMIQSANKSSDLLRRMENSLSDYGATVGVSDQDILNRLSMNESGVKLHMKDVSTNYFLGVLGTQDDFTKNGSKLNTVQKDLLNRTEDEIDIIESYKKEYKDIASGFLSFLETFKSDAEDHKNPLKVGEEFVLDAEAYEKYEAQKNAISTGFDYLVAQFKKAYIEPNLYE